MPAAEFAPREEPSAVTAALAPVVEGEPKRKGKKKKRGPEPSTPSSPPPAPPDAREQERRALELKLARVYADELSRIDDAVLIYKRLLERDPGDSEVTAVLENILRTGDRRDDLRWFFELRIDSAGEAGEKRRLLSEFAGLEEEAFEAPERAAHLYRRMLELDSGDRTALTTLPRLLLSQGDAAGAAQVIAQHRDQLSGESRAEIEAELAGAVPRAPEIARRTR